MAIGAACVWEVRTTGNDTNGGGYAGGGTDWSQQDAAQYSVTDGVTAGTTTITSATANFGTDIVGNVMYVQGGTGSVTAGWYQIISRTNATTIVVDRSTGLTAGTGVTLKIGGAFATPGRLSNLLATGNIAWVKAGTYTITTSTVGPSGPYYQSSNIAAVVEGYNSTRGDRSTTQPELNAGTITNVILWRVIGTNAGFSFINLKANGNTQTGVTGFSYDSSASLASYYCCAINCVTGFSNLNTISCVADTCSGTAFSSGIHIDCYAVSCVTGFSTIRAINCIAKTCSGAGFSGSGQTDQYSYCIADSCVDGFTNSSIHASACIAVNCTRGFRSTVGTTIGQLTDCAGWNNTTNVSGGLLRNFNFQSLAATPFVSSTDYTINTTYATTLQRSPFLTKSWIRHTGAVPPVAGGGSGGIPVARGMHGGMR